MSPRHFTPEQDAIIVRRYTAGESTVQIAKDIDPTRLLSPKTISNTLIRCGVQPRSRNPNVTDAQKAAAVDLCLGGMTTDAAAVHLGIGGTTVDKALRAANVVLPAGRPRSCTVDDNAFAVLTSEALYWVGFLFADGCVHDDRKGAPAVIIGLAECDVGHLEKFRTFLGSTHTISRHETPTSGGGPSVYFRVRSEKLCAALVELGIVNKRTRTPGPELVGSRDFWRGVVDGDGSIGVKKCREYEYPYISLCGQIPLLEEFTKFLVKESLTSLNVSDGTGNRTIYEVGTTGKTARAIIAHLYYEGATPVLDRKMERARLVVSTKQ